MILLLFSEYAIQTINSVQISTRIKHTSHICSSLMANPQHNTYATYNFTWMQIRKAIDVLKWQLQQKDEEEKIHKKINANVQHLIYDPLGMLSKSNTLSWFDSFFFLLFFSFFLFFIVSVSLYLRTLCTRSTQDKASYLTLWTLKWNFRSNI